MSEAGEQAAPMAADVDDAYVHKMLKRLTDWNVTEGRFAKCSCDTCARTSPWGCLLAKLRPKLQTFVAANAEAAERFGAYLDDRPAVGVQTCCLVYLWLADVVTHPLVDQQSVKGLEAAWPLQGSRLPEDVARYLYGAGLPELDEGVFEVSGGVQAEGSNEMLVEFVRMARELSAQVLGQLCVCKCPDMDLLNEWSRQSVEVRRKYAWSVPNEAALSALARHVPLLEIGCGSGYWASLLAARGADIVCYTNKTWVKGLNEGVGAGEFRKEAAGEGFGCVLEGGPEMIEKHQDRALVLMWPDYMGRGSFGLKCLESFSGDTLILVGEWGGRTLGSYTEGLSPHGQSFSEAFQKEVKEGFQEVEVVRIPNWPLFLDVVAVYKRKSLTQLMEEQAPGDGGSSDGFLSAFFMGNFDPFSGAGEQDEEEAEAEGDEELVRQMQKKVEQESSEGAKE